MHLLCNIVRRASVRQIICNIVKKKMKAMEMKSEHDTVICTSVSNLHFEQSNLIKSTHLVQLIFGAQRDNLKQLLQ